MYFTCSGFRFSGTSSWCLLLCVSFFLWKCKWPISAITKSCNKTLLLVSSNESSCLSYIQHSSVQAIQDGWTLHMSFREEHRGFMTPTMLARIASWYLLSHTQVPTTFTQIPRKSLRSPDNLSIRNGHHIHVNKTQRLVRVYSPGNSGAPHVAVGRNKEGITHTQWGIINLTTNQRKGGWNLPNQRKTQTKATPSNATRVHQSGLVMGVWFFVGEENLARIDSHFAEKISGLRSVGEYTLWRGLYSVYGRLR